MANRPWRVYGVSVPGSSHQAAGTPCQDANHYHVLADGALILAMADGAGSASHSHHGSVLAAEQAVAFLARRLNDDSPRDDDEYGWERLIQDTFAEARSTLVSYAAASELSLESLATTFTCAVAKGANLFLGRIGDGIAVVETADGDLITVARPVRGEYANETYFLTQEDALELVEVSRGPVDPTSIVLTTDGLLRLAVQLPSYDPYEPFFRPVLGYVAHLKNEADEQTVVERLAEFLDSERINSRTDDDKTLIIANRARMRGEASGPDALP